MNKSNKKVAAAMVSLGLIGPALAVHGGLFGTYSDSCPIGGLGACNGQSCTWTYHPWWGGDSSGSGNCTPVVGSGSATWQCKCLSTP